ncbi:hypothetical protein LINPERHAP1_LOCUS28277 [Linum perenne]
MATHLGVAVF